MEPIVLKALSDNPPKPKPVNMHDKKTGGKARRENDRYVKVRGFSTVIRSNPPERQKCPPMFQAIIAILLLFVCYSGVCCPVENQCMSDLIQVFRQSISDGLTDRTLTSCSRWAANRRVMGEPFPGPYSWKYHPWVREMHDSKRIVQLRYEVGTSGCDRGGHQQGTLRSRSTTTRRFVRLANRAYSKRLFQSPLRHGISSEPQTG